jgi:hypothetical protein
MGNKSGVCSISYWPNRWETQALPPTPPPPPSPTPFSVEWVNKDRNAINVFWHKENSTGIDNPLTLKTGDVFTLDKTGGLEGIFKVRDFGFSFGGPPLSVFLYQMRTDPDSENLRWSSSVHAICFTHEASLRWGHTECVSKDKLEEIRIIRA